MGEAKTAIIIAIVAFAAIIFLMINAVPTQTGEVTRAQKHPVFSPYKTPRPYYEVTRYGAVPYYELPVYEQRKGTAYGCSPSQISAGYCPTDPLAQRRGFRSGYPEGSYRYPYRQISPLHYR